MSERQKRYCLRFNKNIILSDKDDMLVCECSIPKEKRETLCAVICVHNQKTQLLVAQMKKQRNLSEEDIQTSLEPFGYRDWASIKD